MLRSKKKNMRLQRHQKIFKTKEQMLTWERLKSFRKIPILNPMSLKSFSVTFPLYIKAASMRSSRKIDISSCFSDVSIDNVWKRETSPSLSSSVGAAGNCGRTGGSSAFSQWRIWFFRAHFLFFCGTANPVLWSGWSNWFFELTCTRNRSFWLFILLTVWSAQSRKTRKWKSTWRNSKKGPSCLSTSGLEL